jgi:hypothetical protein
MNNPSEASGPDEAAPHAPTPAPTPPHPVSIKRIMTQTLTANLDHWLDEIEGKGITIEVMRDGKLAATLNPVQIEPVGTIFGAMRGWVLEEHDIISPAEPGWGD